MPTTAKKRRKAQKKQAEPASRSFGWPAYLLCATAGATLGLSAPGFDQWYLAWFGLVPLFLLVAGSNSLWQASLRGFIFGLFYNLVYLNWYLHLYPLDWLGFQQWEGMFLAAAAWLIEAGHQALIVAAFALVLRALPLSGGLLPRRVDERWHLPTIIVVPALWVLLESKIGNAHDALGVPWSMLEYSQYRQLPLIQVTSLVGGIGLGTLIVAVNTAIAGLLATISRKLPWQSFAAKTVGASIGQALAIALIVSTACAWGAIAMQTSKTPADLQLSVVQSNINIDMQKTEHRFTLAELLSHYFSLMKRCPEGVCVLTESAIPTYLREQKSTSEALATEAKKRKIAVVIGAMDREDSRPFNSAYGMTADGELLPAVYHKRYLVPFGEYTPLLVQYLPEWLKRLTNTPSGGGFAAGSGPVVLWLPCGKIAPLICFETLSPELVASSVRNGGQLLTNISDLAWFHDSMIGQQMLAFSVIRAVESHRYFVFAANSGPSAVIDPSGRIKAQSNAGQATLLTCRVGLSQEITPFVLWFH
jgi:apolipoprotein N-acyltransferase